VSIAWASLGEGPPVLLLPFPPTSWLAGWQFVAPIWAPLAERHRLDFSMSAMLRDPEVAVAQLGSEPSTLIAVTNGTPVAFTFAARPAGPRDGTDPGDPQPEESLGLTGSRSAHRRGYLGGTTLADSSMTRVGRGRSYTARLLEAGGPPTGS
jgi:hypothetical protein